jgi:hypothetical protein
VNAEYGCVFVRERSCVASFTGERSDMSVRFEAFVKVHVTMTRAVEGFLREPRKKVNGRVCRVEQPVSKR